MTAHLIGVLERVRADLLAAIVAIRANDYKRAGRCFDRANERLSAVVDEWEQES